MRRLSVSHSSVYRYARPVTFGPHRLMFRPRDSHDLRLVETALTITPNAAIRWHHDVFGNSIAIAEFETVSDTLRFDSRIVVEPYSLENPEFQLEEYARTYPFSYPISEVPDLGRCIERHYPDPDHVVDAWAKRFVQGRNAETTQVLRDMTAAIKSEFAYSRRYAVGTQMPTETLALGGGSCRDLALLMMEAARTLGLAARFVSGYLYDPALEGAGDGVVGAGETHAWVQIYLPGAGWVEYDPTNGTVGGPNLIRVAVSRDPSQAMPLTGTYFGAPDDFIDLSVDVTVVSSD
ncbi:MAG: transglutaminase family protein [Pseudomonadota bacterium]